MRKFGMRDKIAYLSGDLANDFTFILVAAFLMVFYTKVLGISGAHVGLLFLVARVVDAFTDVTMGKIVDMRTPGKDGRFRYWILRVAPFVCFAGFLLFAHWVKDWSYGAKLVYITVTYLFWGSICYTAINIPYGSMASVITDKSEERSALSSFRSMGAAIAQVIIMIIIPKFVYVKDATGQPVVIPERFTIVAGGLCIAAFLLYLFCYYNSVERIEIVKQPKKETSTFEEITSIFKGIGTNKPLLAFIGIAISLLLSMLFVTGMNAYLYGDYFKDTSALAIAGILGIAGTFILVPFVPYITRLFGKQLSGVIGLFASAILYLVLFLFRIQNARVFIVLLFFANLGYTYFNVIIWAFISDIIDDQEVRTGKREDGTIYAVYSFARKIGQALAGGLTGFALSLIGYVPKAAAQTPEVANRIYSIVTLSGVIGFALCGAILLFIYPLSEKKVKENTRILAERKNK